MTSRVPIDSIAISQHHRAIKPWSLERIKQSMKEHGYNTAYPVVIDTTGLLVDGRHRLEAARKLGLDTVPVTYKPADVSAIRFGLQCNADGQLCEADDVFDLAELCYGLAREGWDGKTIADELGWGIDLVSKHKIIRERLAPRAWEVARSTKIPNSSNGTGSDLVERDSTKVEWRETYFRAFLSHLPYTEGDRPVMRAQVRAIREILDRFAQPDKKVTAKWIGELAARYAWHVHLEKYTRDNLVPDVPLRDRIGLIKNIRRNVFGDKEDERSWQKLADAVAALNQRALGVRLYQDDALQRIPLLDDNSIALVVTDPPYNVTDHEWDKIGTDEEYLEWMRSWLSALRPKLRDDYHLFVFCAPRYQARIETILVNDGWPLKSRIIWSHRNLSMGRDVADKFIDMWEMVFHCGTHSLNWSPDWNDERFAVQEHAAPQSNFKNDPKQHPTSKPIKLIKLLVEVGGKPGDTVLDLFAGGGTTGEACSLVGQRRCILVEQDPDYCSVIETRLKIRRITEGE